MYFCSQKTLYKYFYIYINFTYGVADRGSSIRIPRFTNRDKKGYLEDRRPASNMDPYLVTSKIVETTILNWFNYEII